MTINTQTQEVQAKNECYSNKIKSYRLIRNMEPEEVVEDLRRIGIDISIEDYMDYEKCEKMPNYKELYELASLFRTSVPEIIKPMSNEKTNFRADGLKKAQKMR